MNINLKCLIVIILSLNLTTGQGYHSRCPSDNIASTGCPNGWHSFQADCYQFNMTQLNYIDARDACNGVGARLVRLTNTIDYDFISDFLSKNAVNRVIAWYTAGIMDPQEAGRYLWEGYSGDQRQFNSDLAPLFVDVPDLNNIRNWNTDRTKISLLYYEMKWVLNITAATDNLYFICQASKANIAKAVITARTADFGQSDLTKVLRGPCITEQPEDQLFVPVISGSKLVTFKCGVYGNPTPSVSWYFTIEKISGIERILIDPLKYPNGKVTQTGGILTINDPDNSFDNRIECQAENDYGIVLSKQVQIIRGRLELYNKNARQEKIVPDNTGFLLDCEPPDHAPPDGLTFTFYITRTNDKGITFDDVIQSQLRNNVFLSTNLGLIGFSVASAKDDGFYKCMIGWKGVTGTTYKSPDIPVRIQASNTPYPVPIVNDKFPNFRPSNPFLGDTVEFECFGYGEIKENALKYIWTWNKKSLPAKAIISDFERRVTLRNVQFEDEGVYGCHIETHDGKISDVRTTSFTINAKPTFLITPTNQYPDVGSTVTLSCRAIGKPNVTIKWYRNEIPLSTWLAKNVDTRYNYTEGVTSQGLLTITSVQSTDNAMIGCLIFNTFGRDSAYIELKTVSMAPNFNKYPVLNSEAIIGSDSVIRCQPEGSPSPTISWSLNGSPLSPGKSTFNQLTGNIDCSGHLCQLPNNNLFIKTVAVGDRGMYNCTATNILGSASSEAYLDIINPLTVNNYPVGRRVQVNTNVYLPCQASGTPYLDIDYDWYFENVQIRFDRMDLDSRRYDKSKFLRPYYRYFGTLTITNIQFHDEGNYTCRITTPFNTIEMSALIMVLGPPGVVGGIDISSTLVNVSNYVEWTDGYNHGNPILWYRLEVAREDGHQKWYILVDRINKSDVIAIQMQNNLVRHRYMFAGLPANTMFRLRMYAANDFGLGAPSGPSDVFKTSPIPPVKIPQNVTGGGGKVGTLVIRWEPLISLEENGDNFIYEINYKQEKEIEWIMLSNPLNKSIEDDKYRQVTIDLPLHKDYMPYNVQVRASNIKGPGPWSPISTITSASKLPSFAPQDVRAGSFNSTAITVDWKPPEIGPGEGPIQGYHIVYWLRMTDCKSQAANRDRLRTSQRLTVYGGHLQSGTIIGLKADQYYCIGVQMYNTAGDSLESSFVDQTTFKKPPQDFPTIVRLNSTNTPHRIQVTWNGVKVKAEEESVDGYRIRYWESGAPVRIAKDIDVGLKITGYINDLQYDVRYNLRVFAYSRGGNGKLSNPMDQFMLVPSDKCEKDRVIEGPDVRFVFVCSGCRLPVSIVLLFMGFLVARLGL